MKEQSTHTKIIRTKWLGVRCRTWGLCGMKEQVSIHCWSQRSYSQSACNPCEMNEIHSIFLYVPWCDLVPWLLRKCFGRSSIYSVWPTPQDDYAQHELNTQEKYAYRKCIIRKISFVLMFTLYSTVWKACHSKCVLPDHIWHYNNLVSMGLKIP